MADPTTKANGGEHEHVNGVERSEQGADILKSKAIREEMDCMKKTGCEHNIQPSSQLSRAHIFSGKANPIDDISGVASLSSFGNAEKILRCSLASVYRLVDLRGWSEGIFNHITVRLDQDHEHFLLNPFGLMFHEITASSLVKVDLEGNIIDPGTTRYGISPAGYVLHSVIHAARSDIRCIIHIHTPSCIAVSASTHGLLSLSQEALIVGDVSYHDYGGILVDYEEGESIVKDLGPTNKVMFLRNHGIVCCGETIEEAFYNLYYTVLACDTQVKLMAASGGVENLILIPEFVSRKKRDQRAEFLAQRDNMSEEERILNRPVKSDTLLFESYMRAMDNAGYRTGYEYRNRIVRKELPRSSLNTKSLKTL